MKEIAKSSEKIKNLKKIKDKSIDSLMVVEGLDVIKEVIENDIEILECFFNENELREDAQILLKKCQKRCENNYKISLKTFESIREKDNSIPIILIVKYALLSLNKIDKNKHKLIIVNDGLELPGNLGTIYRSAYASGVDLIINVDCITNIYKTKFISSSRGTIFSIPTINAKYEEVQNKLLNLGYDICLCEPENGISFKNYNYSNDTVIVVGSERFGINKKWYNNKHSKIFIPMKKGINSINVSVAASIIMFDAGIKKGRI